jgi:hypothetical protein
MTMSLDPPTIQLVGNSSRSFTLETPPHHGTPTSRRRLSQVVLHHDDASRALLVEHKKYLQQLVTEGRDSLQSMGYYRSTTNQAAGSSSLRTLLTKKLDRMNHSSILQLESDLTEATEDATDFSEESFDGNLVFDFDEQQQASELSIRRRSSLGRSRSRIHPCDDDDDNDDEGDDHDHDENSSEDEHSLEEEEWALNQGTTLSMPVMMRDRTLHLSPDWSLPLRGVVETWQAIRKDTTVTTVCRGCQTELHVVHDAEYVVCLECGVVGPIDHVIAGIEMELEEESDDLYGVAVGVTSDEVIQWVDE